MNTYTCSTTKQYIINQQMQMYKYCRATRGKVMTLWRRCEVARCNRHNTFNFHTKFQFGNNGCCMEAVDRQQAAHCDALIWCVSSMCSIPGFQSGASHSTANERRYKRQHHEPHRAFLSTRGEVQGPQALCTRVTPVRRCGQLCGGRKKKVKEGSRHAMHATDVCISL